MTSNQKRFPALTDSDEMPFGKHRGELMQDVPAHYLEWLWNELKSDGYDRASVGPVLPEHVNVKVKLANYIWNSKEAIEQELGRQI